MPTCAIRWCGKRSKTSSYTKDGITFHRFPNDIVKKEIWMNATRRDNFSPSKFSVICSRHFTPDCFEKLKNNRRRLYISSVPTLYLPSLIPSPVSENIQGQQSSLKYVKIEPSQSPVSSAESENTLDIPSSSKYIKEEPPEIPSPSADSINNLDPPFSSKYIKTEPSQSSISSADSDNSRDQPLLLKPIKNEPYGSPVPSSDDSETSQNQHYSSKCIQIKPSQNPIVNARGSPIGYMTTNTAQTSLNHDGACVNPPSGSGQAPIAGQCCSAGPDYMKFEEECAHMTPRERKMKRHIDLLIYKLNLKKKAVKKFQDQSRKLKNKIASLQEIIGTLTNNSSSKKENKHIFNEIEEETIDL